MTRYQSSDPNIVSTTPEGAMLLEKILADERNRSQDWQTRLRAVGVKLEHPDDGWVDRERCTFSLSWYAKFNDNPHVGDLIAFGRPPRGEFSIYHDDDPVRAMWEGYRIVRVTQTDVSDEDHERWPTIKAQRFWYEDTGMRMPPLKPKPLTTKWWRRIFKRTEKP